MKVLVIVQARMSSTRLPGKIMMEVCGKPLLEHQINRLKGVSTADEIVVATTTNSIDNIIIDLCKKLNISFHRGSENDVLGRYYEASIKYKGDIIVRITSDCPVIDPDVVDHIINFYIKHKDKYDYVSNTLFRMYPRGMDTEVFSFKVLKETHVEATKQEDREHVTSAIYQQPQRYSLCNVPYDSDESHHRWTVDTREDLELITLIYEALYYQNPDFSLGDILNLMESNPDWLSINAHIEQKHYG